MTAIRQKADWPKLAAAYAREAHVDHFQSRRGVWHIEDLDVLCFYNNNPYEGRPKLRDEELAEFRRRMAREGIQELAFATYPPEGHEEASYTFAQIIDAGGEKTDWVVETMRSILMESWARTGISSD